MLTGYEKTLNWRAAHPQGRGDNKRAKRAALDGYKRARGCADCGYAEHACALDFDHLPGSHKRFAISAAVNKELAWDDILAEIEKCDVVCANCHRVRTHARYHS